MDFDLPFEINRVLFSKFLFCCFCDVNDICQGENSDEHTQVQKWMESHTHQHDLCLQHDFI